VAKETLSGAGGYWRVIDEHPDLNVIKQFNNQACAAACGEMLIRDRSVTSISQTNIARLAGGVPMEIPILAIVLNQLGNLPGNWIGAPIGIDGTTDEELIGILNQTGSWGAGFWEDGAPIGHIVIVDGFDENHRICIRDPWGQDEESQQGSQYRMEISGFLEVWSRYAVYYQAP
jgi:Papain-like cysteine protease AvrRpt2